MANGHNLLITSLNSHDILMGRGSQANDYIGNQRYRRLVESMKPAFYATVSKEEKDRIGAQTLNEIHRLGGRFLTELKDKNNGTACGYREVTRPVALKKCIQSLRDRRVPLDLGELDEEFVALARAPPRAQRQLNEAVLNPFAQFQVATISRPINYGEFLIQQQMLIHQQAAHFNPFYFSGHAMAIVPQQPVRPSWHTYNVSSSNMEMSQALHRAGLLQATLNDSNHETAGAKRSHVSTPPSSDGSSDMSVSVQGKASSEVVAPRQEQRATENVPSEQIADASIEGDSINKDGYGIEHAQQAPSEGAESEKISEADAAAFLLSELYLTELPSMTMTEVQAEQAALPKEAKKEVQSDVFGESSTTKHQSKKAKRDLDDETIERLIDQIRLEVKRIPQQDKEALMEAEAKGCPSEFSNDRLERFLWCEDMNVQRAAQRFVKYWEARREVFGATKYVMQMTLSEVLCDDLIALETGMFCLLPHLDSSGRQLILRNDQCHTMDGYTTDSMLRAIWYEIEVSCNEPTNVSSALVFVGWQKNTTLWDFDSRLDDRIAYFLRSCWPVKLAAVHSCCAPTVVRRLLAPIAFAMLDEWTRSRTLTHDTPEDEIVVVLSGYGIEKEMIPTLMGGTLEFSQLEWIADRRAAELEALAM